MEHRNHYESLLPKSEIIGLRVKTNQEMVQSCSYLFLTNNRAYFTKIEYHPKMNLRNETVNTMNNIPNPGTPYSNPTGWLMFGLPISHQS